MAVMSRSAARTAPSLSTASTMYTRPARSASVVREFTTRPYAAKLMSP